MSDIQGHLRKDNVEPEEFQGGGGGVSTVIEMSLKGRNRKRVLLKTKVTTVKTFFMMLTNHRKSYDFKYTLNIL